MSDKQNYFIVEPDEEFYNLFYSAFVKLDKHDKSEEEGVYLIFDTNDNIPKALQGLSFLAQAATGMSPLGPVNAISAPMVDEAHEELVTIPCLLIHALADLSDKRVVVTTEENISLTKSDVFAYLLAIHGVLDNWETAFGKAGQGPVETKDKRTLH